MTGVSGMEAIVLCVSAVEASEVIARLRYKSVHESHSWPWPSREGGKAKKAVLHCQFWVPAFVPKGLVTPLPNLCYLIKWVGLLLPALSRAIRIPTMGTYEASQVSKLPNLFQVGWWGKRLRSIKSKKLAENRGGPTDKAWQHGSMAAWVDVPAQPRPPTWDNLGSRRTPPWGASETERYGSRQVPIAPALKVR